MSSDPAVRKKLFPKIRKELLSHERAERQELYPLLEKHAEMRDIVTEHNREADQIESLIDELEAQGFDSVKWGNTFERLVEVVKHHTSEEEKNYFPKAQEVFGEQRTEALKKQYLKTKQSLAKEITA
jgi:hemerythrin superfamily protein